MIHLSWSGKGYLVPLITFPTCVAMEYGVEAVFKDGSYYQTHGWPIITAFLISSLVLQMLPKRFAERRNVCDEETGHNIVIQQNHKFMFIHLRYWPPILCVLGVVFYTIIELGWKI